MKYFSFLRLAAVCGISAALFSGCCRPSTIADTYAVLAPSSFRGETDSWEKVVAALQTANATFEESTAARTAEISGRMVQSDLSSGDALDAVNDLYKGIVQVVNAYAVVQPTDAVNTFIDSVNGVVEYYSRIAGSSASGGSASEGGNEGGNEGGGGSQGGTDDGSDDGEL